MKKFGICLSLLFATNISHAMTYEQRQRLSDIIESSIVTMHSKHLPPKLVKNSLASATGVDREILKSTFASWPKNYSKFMTYKNEGDSILFSYKFVPLLKMRIIKFEPYTVMLNEHREVVLKPGQGIQALKNALVEEGFGAGSKKHALLELLPEANAEDASAQVEKTFENSVILVGDFGWNAVSHSTVPLVEQGYLLPDTRYRILQKTRREDRVTCDGKTAVGKIADGDGTLLDFKASRSEGVEIEKDGVTIKSSTKPFNASSCGDLNKLPASLDSESVKRIVSDQEIENLRQNYIQEQISTLGKNAIKDCLDQNIKDAEEYLSRDSRIIQDIYEYSDYRERARAEEYYWNKRRTEDDRFENSRRRSKQDIIPRQILAVFRAKCQWEYSKTRSTDAFKQELAKQTADAEAEWKTRSDSQISRDASAKLNELTSACRMAKEAKPKLELDCSSPSTIGQAKNLCAALDSTIVGVSTELEICYPDKTCDKKLDYISSLSNARDYMKVRGEYHAALSKFKTDQHKYFENGALSEKDGVINIDNPNKLDGDVLKTIMEERNRLAEMAGKRPTYSYSMRSGEKVSPSPMELIRGAMGLLDCCYDIECKKGLADKGVIMSPIDGTTHK